MARSGSVTTRSRIAPVLMERTPHCKCTATRCLTVQSNQARVFYVSPFYRPVHLALQNAVRAVVLHSKKHVRLCPSDNLNLWLLRFPQNWGMASATDVECRTDEGEVTSLVLILMPLTIEIGVQAEAGAVFPTRSQTDEVVLQHPNIAHGNDHAGIFSQTPAFSLMPHRTTHAQSNLSKFSDDGSADMTVRSGRLPGPLSTLTESAGSDIGDGITFIAYTLGYPGRSILAWQR